MLNTKKITASLVIATISFSPLALGYNYVNAMDEALNDVQNEKISEGVKYVKASTFEEAKKKYVEATEKLNSASAEKKNAESNNSRASQALEAAKIEEKKSEENLNQTNKKANELFGNIVSTYEARKIDAEVAEKNAKDAYTQKASELSELQDKLDKAKSDVVDAKSKLDEIKSQYPGIEEYKEKKEKYDSLSKEIENLQKKIDETSSEIASLESDVSTANKKVQQTTKDVETKKSEVDNAQKKLEDAKKELNDAKIAEQNASNEDKAASEQLAKAEKKVESATAALDTAKTDLEKSEKAKKDAEKKLDALGDIDKHVKDMQDEIDVAKSDVADAQKKVDNLKTELAPLESTKTSAIADYNLAQNELKLKESAVSEIDKEIETKKAEVKIAVDAWNAEIKASEDRKNAIENKTIGDARELFDELAADGYNIDQIIADAVQKSGNLSITLKDRHGIEQSMTIQEISEHPAFKRAIKEATSKENVYKSIQLIEEFNEIRKAEGLSELKINGPLMVSSIVANAFSMFTLDNTFIVKLWTKHTDNTSTPKGFQNLSWGLDKNGDPYQEWYYKQKELKNQGNNIAKLIHNYKDITNKDATITGLSATTAFGKYEGTQSYHQFITVVGKYEKERGRSFTANEFKQLVDEYFKKPTAEYLAAEAEVDRIKNTKPQTVLDAENALAISESKKPVAIQAVNDQKAVVNDKNDKVAEAQSKIDEKNAEILLAEQERANKQAIVDEKQKNLDKFVTDNDVEKEKIRLKKLIDDFDAKIGELNSSIPNLENDKNIAISDLNTARTNKQNNANILAAAQILVQNKMTAFDVAENQRIDAQNALANSKTIDDEAKTVLENLMKKLDAKKAVKLNDQNKMAAKTTERSALNLPALPAGKYEDFLAKKDSYNQKLKEKNELSKTLVEKEKALDETKKALDEAKTVLDNANDMLAKANLIDINNPATYSSFPELVAATNNLENAKTRRNAALNDLSVTNTNAVDAEQALKDAEKKYNEALVDYNFAKEDYERFLAIEQENQAKRKNEVESTPVQRKTAERLNTITSLSNQNKQADESKTLNSKSEQKKQEEKAKITASKPAQKIQTPKSDADDKDSDNNHLYGYGAAAGLAGASAIAVVGMKRRKKNK